MKLPLMLLVAVLCMQSALAAAPAGEWWDASYQYRQNIEIPAGTTNLPTAYSVSFVVNHASLVTGDRSILSGNDMRIVRWNGSGWTELDRMVDPDSGWNLNNTRVWFRTQAQVNANSTDDNYYLYYGNSTAGAPPQSSAQIFSFYDDFSGTSLDGTKWTIVNGAPIVSGGQFTQNVNVRVRSLGTFGIDTIWESSIRMPTNLPGGSSATFHYWQANDSASNNANQYLDVGNHVGFRAITGSTIDAASTHQVLSRSAAGETATISPGNPTAFQYYSFTRTGDASATFFINGAHVGSLNTDIPTGSLPIQLFNAANGSRTQVYDWVRVRAYRNPEPELTLVSDGSVHFVVAHDGYGIHCAPEPVTVQVRDAANNPYLGYGQTITLNTNSGRGNWSLLTGGGSLNNGSANDGIATYVWSGTDSSATFALSYPEGTPAINIDVFQSTDTLIRDEDSEGLLTWTPSGFTVTAAPLSNPPPASITTFASPQTAGTDFTLYIAAYGTTPSDPQCGIIESYAGPKNLSFWSTYANPTTGTRQITIPAAGSGIATTEGSATQAVIFTNGQASVTARYRDVGSISVSVKDTSVSQPVGGLRGATNNFVVRPATFVLSGIQRTSGGVVNPGASTATGPVFMAAGAAFSATLEARDSLGGATPNFGRESTPESVRLQSNLQLPSGGNNPAVGGSFGAFNNGVATGTAFTWAEVGIITLTPRLLDGDYLGAGDVIGATSGNVGRFIPNDFGVTASAPSFASSCSPASFSYMGQPMNYAVPPVLTLTARAVGGATMTNYRDAFFKLQNGAPNITYTYGASEGALDQSSLPSGDPVAVSLNNGVGTLTFGTASELRFLRTTPVAPFTPTLSLSVTARDSDNVTTETSPFVINNITSPEQRYGRIAFRNAVGSELLNLPLPMQAEYFLNDSIGFVRNTDDSCTTGVTLSFSNFGGDLGSAETCVIDAANPGVSGIGCATPGAIAAQRYASPPIAGDFRLFLQASGATAGVANKGTVTVTAAVPDWLDFDWNTAAPGLEDPSGIATFGVFQGSPNRIFQGER